MTSVYVISQRGGGGGGGRCSSRCSSSWYYILQGDIVGIQVNADSSRTEKKPRLKLSGSCNPEIPTSAAPTESAQLSPLVSLF